MDQGTACVYILASDFQKIYIGVTTELRNRVSQHKRKAFPDCHTARYNIHRLVHVERFVVLADAIAREKKLKGWRRVRKIELIVATNPTWRDLSEDFGKAVGFY